MTESDAARAAAEMAARRSYGKLVAFLAARTRDVAAAEDALADAFAAALRHWPTRGVPDSPEAFIAWSVEPLPQGTSVLVVESRGARQVDVMEWTDPLGEAPVIPGSTEVPRSGE